MVQKSKKDFSLQANQLLDWFYKHGRKDLPWRVVGGAHDNAYAVWISEIMLQQTTVQTVKDYFVRWMDKFPTVESLAQANLDDVLHAWQGLGYYSRARKIYECAQILVEKYNGHMPETRDDLLKLPGIGPYSSASICAFAFNKPETVVDGNVVRVIARHEGLEHFVTKDEIYDIAKLITPQDNGADYASAIMDLGACVCTPKNALCESCPWQKTCKAYQLGLVSKIPQIKKLEKKQKKGVVFLIQNEKGEYFIQKRTEKGLLNGLYEFLWVEYDNLMPFDIKKCLKLGSVSHTFTHFQLSLDVFFVKSNNYHNPEGIFVSSSQFKDYAFSTLMKKVWKFC